MLNYRKHNLWRVIVDFLFGNDEKVASSEKHTHRKARMQNPYPIYDQNGWKSVPITAAHTYTGICMAHIMEYLAERIHIDFISRRHVLNQRTQASWNWKS